MIKIITILLISVIASIQLEASLRMHKSTKQEVLATSVDDLIHNGPGMLRDSYSYNQGSTVVAIYSTGSKRQPRELLLLWRESSRGYTLMHKMETFPGETLDKPLAFTTNQLNFLNVSTDPAGSGGFVVDTMLWLAPDGTVHPVEFKQASEVYESVAAGDEVIITGGEKEFFYDADQMRFQFWIAQNGDPHCCPSKGAVTGTYKLRGLPHFDHFTRRYKADFQIIVDQLEHDLEHRASKHAGSVQ